MNEQDNTPRPVCTGCGEPLALGEAEEALTYRTAPEATRPGRYFCGVSEDARHHMEPCEHSEYPEDGCANCEERLGLDRPDVQVVLTYPDEEAWQAARVTRVQVLPAGEPVNLIDGLQHVHPVVSEIPPPEMEDRPSRPAKGTPEYELWLCAIEVATAAPWKQSKHTGNAGVYWPRVHRLRRALDACGIDWEAAKRREDEAAKR